MAVDYTVFMDKVVARYVYVVRTDKGQDEAVVRVKSHLKRFLEAEGEKDFILSVSKVDMDAPGAWNDPPDMDLTQDPPAYAGWLKEWMEAHNGGWLKEWMEAHNGG